MSLSLAIPDTQVSRAPDLRVALWYEDGWDWDWLKSDLGARLRVESVELGIGDRQVARLFVNPAGQRELGETIMEPIRLGEAETICPAGQRLCIYAQSDPNDEETRAFLFDGLAPVTKLQFTEAETQIELLCTGLVRRVACGSSAISASAWIYGRWMARADGTLVHVPGLRAEFNPEGKPNRAATLRTVNDIPNVPVFTYEGDPKAKPWTMAAVLTYLLAHYWKPAGTLAGILDGNGISRCVDLLTTDGAPVPLTHGKPTFLEIAAAAAPELVMHGMHVVDALDLWCRAGGCRYTATILNKGGEPETSILFWRQNDGGPYVDVGTAYEERTVVAEPDDTPTDARYLRLPEAGYTGEDATPEVQRLDVLYDGGNLVSWAVRIGDPVRYEVTVGRTVGKPGFLPGWLPDATFGDNLSGAAMAAQITALKATTAGSVPTSGTAKTLYDRYDKGGANHASYSAAGRVWVLNEAGEYGGELYGRSNGGNSVWALTEYVPYDFHASAGVPIPLDPDTGEEVPWIARRRAVEELLSVPDGKETRSPLIECSWDSGAHWYPYPGTATFLGRGDEEAQIGLVLTDANLAAVVNQSPASGDTTKGMSVWEAIVRGSFRLALTCTVAGDDCVSGHTDHFGALAGVDRTAISVGRVGELVKQDRTASRLRTLSGWSSTTRDDSDKAVGQANLVIGVFGERLVSGTLVIPWVTNDWMPGDACRGIHPRGIGFRRASGSTGGWPEVVRTLIVSGNRGCSTQVTLDDGRTISRYA